MGASASQLLRPSSFFSFVIGSGLIVFVPSADINHGSFFVVCVLHWQIMFRLTRFFFALVSFGVQLWVCLACRVTVPLASTSAVSACARPPHRAPRRPNDRDGHHVACCTVPARP
jgi:hypothetical protein